MLKVMPLAVVAGLTFIHTPEAAAHPGVHETHVVPVHGIDYRRASHPRHYYRGQRHDRNYHDRYYYEKKRAYRMPRWLKRNRSFRRWYRNSPYNRHHYLRWNELYDIYRWERRYYRYRRY